MNSDHSIQYSERGQLVYFEVDIKELFNVNLSFPGVISALNKAFNVSKTAVPVKTGLMLRSYTMKKVSSSKVRCYFDPKKIVGQKRLGRIVKEYYPQYLVDTPKRYDWLHVLIMKFYRALEIEMLKLSKENKEVSMEIFYMFLLMLIHYHRKRKEEEKKRLAEEKKRKEELEKKKQEYIQSLKNRRK